MLLYNLNFFPMNCYIMQIHIYPNTYNMQSLEHQNSQTTDFYTAQLSSLWEKCISYQHANVNRE